MFLSLQVSRAVVSQLQSRCYSAAAPIMTIKEARNILLKMVGTSTDYGPNSMPKVSRVRKSQDELADRGMQDGYWEAIIPLETDLAVRERYITFQKGIRFGRIMEDLDTLAGCICYTHYSDPDIDPEEKSPVGIVTALVDRIELHNYVVSPYHDIKMTGHMAWVGTSSMEVTMNLEQEIHSTWQKILNARFIMVARDPVTNRAAVVNRLVPKGPEEEALFRKGEASKLLRQEEARKMLLKTPPSNDEILIVHDLFLQTIDTKGGTFKVRIKPPGSVWMEKTLLKNMIMCHPEQRNVHYKIFGGFLMRQAMEVAWTNAAMYSCKRPVLKVVDDIVFKKPVEIGSLLLLSSQVVYTHKSLMQVKVHAEVLDVDTGVRETTNDFHFTFDSQDENLPRVIPKSYAEFMLYLDGKRHFES
ncbi:acyl-coenzyme A thioesterase 9, mitochondrial-like [Haliotis rufescens]|uniref:acyl-coenzyme A thioesterase 9, mitochondrial-like n=1 Tax=Haliotis rufescens TaxID=6454 RepID=UPI00201F02C9|nr:acyl-coenzyme A thioesterase 9, mitochondrial-like [Haliotis rufescens]XP_048247173.1 acyl-coenzyme A thioesterase 9, mitochondrial-like [Haliotis rufescens]XP_048247174.1 acyl-coenzyme A thioesterase 9, mitochondrial-like [Haliotis rufescens]XP_048247175.1 acyl-coenzyme A thioesterase 9, mitochondrial-like [Haliotis rufescens]XP_048247176.1 acyl-coenzyme A thioesterase 9, mitochondrial-like [Haliotis rufescens]